MKRMILLVTALLVITVNLTAKGEPMISTKAPIEYVQAELAKLAPVELKIDLSTISPNDKAVLKKLVEAGKLIDELFLLQVSPDNPALKTELSRQKTPEDQSYLELFKIMFGPWNRLDENKPFINTKPKPLAAGFYPEDMSKDEFTQYITTHPDQADKFESVFTVIRRNNGELIAFPYHEEYQKLVKKVSQLLAEAAELSDDPTLKNYLKLRSRNFLTDDYYESDMAWMDLSGNLEVVIGPYEVYEDRLFSYKSAYEAFICVVDQAESDKLATASQYLVEMEKNLPIPDIYKNFNRGLSSPIKVVQEVFSAGDTKAGVQTTAFNLPNDERVREAKGSKKVMLKNIAEAKYQKCWIPIVTTILAEKPLANVSFDAYFNHVLMHEISHGLGPGLITLEDGTQTSVSRELKELYPIIEECKADILGIYNILFLMDKGVFLADKKYNAFASYLGGMFRSIRFGIGEAHGGGVAIQFNYFVEKGAFYENANGKLDLDPAKMEQTVRELSEKVLMIQARGDYQAANQLVNKYSIMTPLMQKNVDKLTHLPIDIRPIFPALD